MNADSIQKLQAIYKSYKQQVRLEKIGQILNISNEDLEDIPEELLMFEQEQTGLMNQNFLDNNSVNKEPDNRKRAETKRNVANSKDSKSNSV
jgi:hypothetical protein